MPRDGATQGQGRSSAVVPPDITLSIVSHGHGLLLERLLTQLASVPGLAGVPVLVTLNALGEADIAPARYAPLAVEVIRNPTPKGFGANHNAAFQRCRTAWFGILNPDLELGAAEPFGPICRYAAGIHNPGALSPVILGSTGEPEDAVRPNLTPWSLVKRHLLGRRALPHTYRPAGVDSAFFWMAGMCLVVSARAFRAVGGFDERFFMYCEDYDLCARLYEAGYTLARDHASEIVHVAQRSSHRSQRYLYWHLASLAKVWTSRVFWRITWHTVQQRLRR